MSITVDYSTTPWLITVPKSDLTLESGTKYVLTVDTFWLLLRDYADSQESIPNPIIYNRIPATASTPSITEINLDYYRIQFEDGVYSVNITNGNTNIREAEIKNQVSVNTNNTTGFIDPTFLEQGLFNGQVAIDPINGVAGTGKTASGEIIGTRQTPVNNITDAVEIAHFRGLRRFILMDNLFISSVDLSDGHSFFGDSPFLTLTIDPSADVTGCDIHNLTVYGELDGLNVIRDCAVGNVTNVSGFLEKCSFFGTVTINGQTNVFECYSHVPGSGYPTFDVSEYSFIVRNFRGSFGLINAQTGHISSCGIYGGNLIVDSTCIGGEIHVRGDPHKITDNSGVGCTVVNETTLDNKKVLTIPKYLALS